MKHTFTLLTSLLALGVAATVHAQEIKFPSTATPAPAPAAAAPAATPAAPAPTFTDAQVLETIGWFMGKNSQAETFEFTPAQIEIVMRGFAGAVAGKASPYELKQIGPQVQAFVAAKQEAYVAKLKVKGLQESAVFLTEIKKKPGVITLPSGLAYEIIKPGEGATPKPNEIVTVNFTGALIDGFVFDSSEKHGGPADFPLNEMIPGWSEGVQKIAKGGKIKLYIPPQLAFGDDGRPGIPPASTVIFEVEILDIKSAPVAPAMPAPAGK